MEIQRLAAAGTPVISTGRRQVPAVPFPGQAVAAGAAQKKDTADS